MAKADDRTEVFLNVLGRVNARRDGLKERNSKGKAR